MSKIRNVLVAVAAFVWAASSSQAATIDQFEVAAGGQTESLSVTVIGDPSGFTAFGGDWFVSALNSPASADITKQEFVFAPVPGAVTSVALSLIDQVIGASEYRGIFEVVTDISGTWGEFAIVELSAGTFSGFSSGTLTVTAAVETITPIPLPAGGFLLLSGLAGLAAFRRILKSEAKSA